MKPRPCAQVRARLRSELDDTERALHGVGPAAAAASPPSASARPAPEAGDMDALRMQMTQIVEDQLGGFAAAPAPQVSTRISG